MNERHPLNLIREGWLPMLHVSRMFEGFVVRLQWRSSAHLLNQASPPWVNPWDEIPF